MKNIGSRIKVIDKKETKNAGNIVNILIMITFA
jgi:hypothetical protein